MIKRVPRISAFQLYCIILQAQFGSAIISIAHAVNAKSGTGAWVACLIAGLINTILVYLSWKLASLAPTSNVFQLVMQRLGGFAGRLFLSIVALFNAGIAYVILTYWIYTTSLWAYERTPSWFLLLALLSVCIYLVLHPVTVYARFAVFATFFVPLFAIFSAYTLKDWNPYNLLPIFEAGSMPILDGSVTVLSALMGVEVMLILPRYYQHIEHKKVLRVAMYSNMTTTLLYAFCVFSSTALFGTETISFIREPMLYQLKSISFNVIERIDLIVISVWILFIMTSFCTYFMLSVSSISAMLKKKEEAPLPLAIGCGVLLFAASLFRLTAEQIDRMHESINYIAPTAVVALVAFLLLILKVAKTTSRS